MAARRRLPKDYPVKVVADRAATEYECRTTFTFEEAARRAAVMFRVTTNAAKYLSDEDVTYTVTVADGQPRRIQFGPAPTTKEKK